MRLRIVGIALALSTMACAAEEPRSYGTEPIELEASGLSRGSELSEEVRDLLVALDDAPSGSTLRYEREVVLDDGRVVIDPVVVTVSDELPAGLLEAAETAHEAPSLVTPIDGPLPIATCRIADTVPTRSRSRAWESCFVFPDDEARRDALRAVSASVEATCRDVLDTADGPALCGANARWVRSSTISTDGICEVETLSTTITHSRGSQTCWFGATATFVSTARATSTNPRCGFACQSLL